MTDTLTDLAARAVDTALEQSEVALKAIAIREILDDTAQDILAKYEAYPAMTERQFLYLSSRVKALEEITPIYGDFKAIMVMFRLASSHLKRPKIRLLTKEGVFVQLTFNVEQQIIYISKGGWAGHGPRRHLGKIQDNLLIPRHTGAFTPDIENLLQDFSMDPAAVAKASALKLSACSFCGQRLSDRESKSRGYGPVCADHFHLPWGSVDEEAIKRRKAIAEASDLSDLFS